MSSRIRSYTAKQAPAHSDRGFTLIELLVVVAIIVILIAILIPSLSNAREQGRRAKCMSVLRSFGQANYIYAAEWDGWYVPNIQDDPNRAGFGDGNHNVWFATEVMHQILGAPLLQPVSTPPTFSQLSRWPARFLCPNASLDQATANSVGFCSFYRTYGYNRFSMHGPKFLKTFGGTDYSHYYFQGMKSPSVVRASEGIQFADALDFEITVSNVSGSTTPVNEPSNYYITNNWQEVVPPTQNNFIAYRHNHGANVVFFDGHGEWLSYRNVLTALPIGNFVPPLTSDELLRNTRRWDYAPLNDN